MKKIFYCMMALAMCVAFVSCEKNEEPDPFEEIEFKYYEPCTNWGCTKADVSRYMSSMPGWTMDTDDNINTLNFSNEKMRVSLDYDFKDGKLTESTLIYVNYKPADYVTLKSEVQNRYGIEYREMQYGGYLIYYGTGKDASGNVLNTSVTDQTSQGFYLMTVSFSMP